MLAAENPHQDAACKFRRLIGESYPLLAVCWLAVLAPCTRCRRELVLTLHKDG